MMKRWKVVGWYSYDPHNEHVKPFARVVYVEAEDHLHASDAGAEKLDALYEKENVSVDFLNWFTSEAPSFTVPS